jgi:hypothetical protein
MLKQIAQDLPDAQALSNAARSIVASHRAVEWQDD